jgi:ketosteroid isomerase-like protein
MTSPTSADLVRGYTDALNRAARTGDHDEWLAHFSDEVEWEAIEDAPDAGTYRGHAGLRGYLEDWLGTVDNLHFDLGEVTAVGDGIAFETRVTALVKGTDTQMELPYAIAIKLADGKIMHGKEFRERAEALAYLGDG